MDERIVAQLVVVTELVAALRRWSLSIECHWRQWMGGGASIPLKWWNDDCWLMNNFLGPVFSSCWLCYTRFLFFLQNRSGVCVCVCVCVCTMHWAALSQFLKGSMTSIRVHGDAAAAGELGHFILKSNYELRTVTYISTTLLRYCLISDLSSAHCDLERWQ